MVINPLKMVKDNHIRAIEGCPPIDTTLQVQQNGIDLRLNTATLLYGQAAISENKKVFPERRVLEPMQGPEGFGLGFYFRKGLGYSVETMEYVEVPLEACASIDVRSTLNRCACLVTTGNWDSGFRGNIGVTLRPLTDIFIEKGTRISQILFHSAEAATAYNGSYQGQAHQYDVVSH